ncbi:hypothetical protein CFC21_045775 [Triticum aestivum]|uniref:F-box domain-containing protein n=2 Tax=Triticum aestivum TaxID=4565 RepID=A0A3B6GQN7_WHEAT|nr:uncharacterized protein LOC123077080 [Triticum aestivum]KAF7034809.1 hypothetical protein CFC21_045775 [Triticum aestivum]
MADEAAGANCPRRSTRLLPRIHANEEEAEIATRRCSPRLHPQTLASKEVSGVTRRSSPRFHPQIHASGDGEAARVTRRRRRGTSPEAADSLPASDDLLREILLRLPPQPSSLPRAAAACKRWLRVAADPRFLRGFSAHHGKPPLLGVFEPLDWEIDSRGLLNRRSFKRRDKWIAFTPILDPPDRIPPQRFDLRRHGVETGIRSRAQLLGCRHGRLLIMDHVPMELVVYAPITGEQRRLAVPSKFKMDFLNAAVLCADDELGHVHGSCHWSPFKVVLVSMYRKDNRPVACVYSSEAGVWGNLISTDARWGLVDANPGILVGNVLYWSSKSVCDGEGLCYLDRLTNDIIEFDLDTHSLAVIKGPPCLSNSLRHQIVKADDGSVGLTIVFYGRFKMWQRNIDCHGVATWLNHKSIQMHHILGLSHHLEISPGWIDVLGYDEDNGVIVLHVDASVYMVQLMSMQSKKLYRSYCPNNRGHPFTSFYAPAIPAGCDGAEMLHDT